MKYPNILVKNFVKALAALDMSSKKLGAVGWGEARTIYISWRKWGVSYSISFTDKVPYFNNVLAKSILEETKQTPENKKELLTEALTYFKKANDAGFLTPRFARMVFEADVQDVVDVSAIFSTDELEQLKRLGASTSSEEDHVEVVEMTPSEEAVEQIDF